MGLLGAGFHFPTQPTDDGESIDDEPPLSPHFRALYRPPDDINPHGSISEAMTAAKASMKWLLVNIQNSDNLTSSTLNIEVWGNETIRQIIQSAFVFFQREHTSRQGKSFITNHNIASTPIVCIIDPRTGRKVKQWTGDKFRGPMTATDILSDFMVDYPYGSSPPTTRPSVDSGNAISVPESPAPAKIEEVPAEMPELAQPGDLDEVKVAIRLSNGNKRQVSFREGQSLRVINQWVSATEGLPLSKFEVRLSHPPKTLDGNGTVGSAGVKGALLVVVLI